MTFPTLLHSPFTCGNPLGSLLVSLLYHIRRSFGNT
nr:MAG TPA: hypothetical protein [Caudoviricetes sp.]